MDDNVQSSRFCVTRTAYLVDHARFLWLDLVLQVRPVEALRPDCRILQFQPPDGVIPDNLSNVVQTTAIRWDGRSTISR